MVDPFLDSLSSPLTDAIGVIAPLILEEKARELGGTMEHFPVDRRHDLIDGLGKEIFNETTRKRFISKAMEEVVIPEQPKAANPELKQPKGNIVRSTEQYSSPPWPAIPLPTGPGHFARNRKAYLGAGSFPFAENIASNLTVVITWLLELAHIPMPEKVQIAVTGLTAIVIAGFIISITPNAETTEEK